MLPVSTEFFVVLRDLVTKVQWLQKNTRTQTAMTTENIAAISAAIQHSPNKYLLLDTAGWFKLNICSPNTQKLFEFVSIQSPNHPHP